MRTHRKIFLLSLSVLALLLGNTYIEHFQWFLSTASQGRIVEGQWLVALAYIGFFVGLAYFLRPSKRKDEWKKRAGVYSTFFIALFAEMFGFPLTLYLLSIFTEQQPSTAPTQVATSISVFGFEYSLMLTTILAMVFSLLCALFIIYSWKKVFNSKKLVTSGPYAITRHPQYTGIIAMTLVWAVSWPTVTTLLLAPIVTWLYYTLARDEEKRMLAEFPGYREYAEKVPMLVP